MRALHKAWNWSQIGEFDRILSAGPERPSPHETDTNGRTALWLSAAIGSVAGIRFFFERGADLDFRCPATGYTPLHAAVFWRHPETAGSLLSLGASSDECDHHAQTPLMRACLGGSLDSANLLVEFHANVNLKDMNGRTALHMSVARRRTGIVRALLAAGAAVDVQDEKGVTSLMIAGNLDCVRLLLDHGASTDLRDLDGLSVRDHMKRRAQVLEILAGRG